MSDEDRIVELIRERLVRGEREYGSLDLAHDGRSWALEALEEALDLSVYLAALHMRITELESAARAVVDAAPIDVNRWQQVGVIAVPVQALTRLGRAIGVLE